jgi:hypothetical protein
VSRARIELDFARRPRRLRLRGVVLLAAGVAAAVLSTMSYQDARAQRSVLEMRLANLDSTRHVRKPDKTAERVATENRAALAELTTPWSRLLQELEEASAQSDGRVAVLGIEPDRDKHQLRVIAEARTLAVALAYVQRLQSADALRYPMLESHEVQVRDPEKPVRFQIRADWGAP